MINNDYNLSRVGRFSRSRIISFLATAVFIHEKIFPFYFLSIIITFLSLLTNLCAPATHSRIARDRKIKYLLSNELFSFIAQWKLILEWSNTAVRIANLLTTQGTNQNFPFSLGPVYQLPCSYIVHSFTWLVKRLFSQHHLCLHPFLRPFIDHFNTLRLSSTHYSQPFQVSAMFLWFRFSSGWYSAFLASSCFLASSKHAWIMKAKGCRSALFQTKQNVFVSRKNMSGKTLRRISITFSMAFSYSFWWYVY